MQYRLLVLMFLSVFLFTAPANADVLHDVTERHNFEATLRLAKLGYAEAQANLGARYAFGCGVEYNHTESAKWYLKAAEQGHVWSQIVIGDAYYRGTGVPKDYGEAAKWLLKAAEKRPLDWNTLYTLGSMYAGGEGVKQDNAKAYYWFSREAILDREDIASRNEVAALLTPKQKAAIDKSLKKWERIKPPPVKAGSAEDTDQWIECQKKTTPSRRPPAYGIVLFRSSNPTPPSAQRK